MGASVVRMLGAEGRVEGVCSSMEEEGEEDEEARREAEGVAGRVEKGEMIFRKMKYKKSNDTKEKIYIANFLIYIESSSNYNNNNNNVSKNILAKHKF